MAEKEPIPIPIPEEVRDIFSDLLGRACVIDKTKDRIPFGKDELEVVIGDFILDQEDGAVGAVVCADLNLAAYSGAALVMMPVKVAEEAIDDGRVDGDMFDCFREVLNVMGRMLNGEESPHVKLRDTYRSGDLIPGGTRTLITEPDRRTDYLVTIEEYGTGKLAIMVKGKK